VIDKKFFTHDFSVKSLSVILKGFMSNTINRLRKVGSYVLIPRGSEGRMTEDE